MHSTEYRYPGQLPDGPVVVVGGGNTGYQIAEELVSDLARVHLAIGTRQTPLPQRILRRGIRFLQAGGLMAKTVDSRLAGQRMKGRETLIGSSPRRARKQGIRLRPRVTGAEASSLTFADGTQQAASAVIWATGFRLDHSLVKLPVTDERGEVGHRRGVTDMPGLYFLGLPWQHTRGSALLGWVKDDAHYIAERIAERARTIGPGTFMRATE